ncbi:hypothetical protein D9V84_04215 [Bacteroidetes/Chlorobi group bacterium Naka2016]|jgi:hypothetical protein|nr:MAG: hypothetical protein D9V84_04215 [Bacteroidetes/Chlorobi group bacterium Naka2016]
MFHKNKGGKMVKKILFIYLLFFSYSISLILIPNILANDCPQNPICFGGSCDCSNWSSWEEKMEAIDMGQYGFPQCTLWVWYCYRQCMDPGKENCVEINITTIQAKIPYCGECEGFFNWLNSDDEWTIARRTRNVINYLFRTIVIRNWFRFLEDLPQEFWPYCDDPDSPRQKFIWWQANCRGYCFTQYPIGQPDVRFLITIKDCMEPYCCGREIDFCVDRATNQTIIETRRIGGPPTECPSVRIPLNECPPGQNVQSTSCIDNCEDVE